MGTNNPLPIEWATSEQTEYFQTVCEFARRLAEDVRSRDPQGTFSREAWRRCGDVGILALPAPETYGGANADAVTTMLALEAMGYGCNDAGLVFSINAHMWTSVIPLAAFGTDEQKEKWLPGLCSGQFTGDLVRLRSDHNYEFLGRRDFQIKSRGFRIELGEIEVALSAHSSIDEAAVVGIPHAEWGSAVVAWIVPSPGADLTEIAVKRHVASLLPRYMVPLRVLTVAEFPRTSTGKIDRPNLVEQSSALLL